MPIFKYGLTLHTSVCRKVFGTGRSTGTVLTLVGLPGLADLVHDSGAVLFVFADGVSMGLFLASTHLDVTLPLTQRI